MIVQPVIVLETGLHYEAYYYMSHYIMWYNENRENSMCWWRPQGAAEILGKIPVSEP